jgi:hypothetical protein
MELDAAREGAQNPAAYETMAADDLELRLSNESERGCGWRTRIQHATVPRFSRIRNHGG